MKKMLPYLKLNTRPCHVIYDQKLISAFDDHRKLFPLAGVDLSVQGNCTALNVTVCEK